MSECAVGGAVGDFFKLIFILWDTIFDDFLKIVLQHVPQHKSSYRNEF
jgi:hypothetical protein